MAEVDQVKPVGTITVADPPLKVDARLRVRDQVDIVRGCWAVAWSKISDAGGACVLVFWFGTLDQQSYTAWLAAEDGERHEGPLVWRPGAVVR